MMLKESIEKLIRRENLPPNLCKQVMDELLEPSVNQLQVAAFLVLLRAKNETAEELSAIVKSLREKMIVVPTKYDVLDIVGTGGDGYNTVNISTGSALLAASCGIKVAKHGNRSVSSLTGSADVLEALGVNIQLTPEQISKSIDQIGIGFCYSPNFHPMTQAVRRLRKELNIPTFFNLIGPLLNPANASHLVLGVLNEALVPVIADVLIKTNTKRSVIVHGMGLDEISCAGNAKVIEVKGKDKNEYTINPLDYGFARCSISALRGGKPPENAEILLSIFKGKQGAIAETFILNAAVAMYIYGLHPSISEAVNHARDKLYSGEVLTLLNNWIEFSHDK